MWKQVIYPNLDDSTLLVEDGNGNVLGDWLGWCLAVTQKQFGVAPFAWCARVAWEGNPEKHVDYDLPDGVFVPVFWTGDVNGWGHIAIALREGDRVKVWTSPWRHKPYLDYFEGGLAETLNYISAVYGMKNYVGWSSVLNTTRIAEWEEPQAPALRSDEEICAEIWGGLWGNGQERINRLKEAGYDIEKIQKMVDAGVGKPKSQLEEEVENTDAEENPRKSGMETPENPELPPDPSNNPVESDLPEDDVDTISTPETPPAEPPVGSEATENEEKFEEAPVVPETLSRPKQTPDETPQTGGGNNIWTLVIRIVQHIIKILTTKKEK